MKVNEVFGPTIQGEGKYVGTPSFFVRTTGCNLRCWVNVPGRGIAKVCYPDGSLKNINDVKENDVILAIDEITKQLVETTVKYTRTDEISEWIQLTVDKIGTINVTPEHPFQVSGRGWVTAENLKENDILEHVDGTERNSYRMKHYNTMFDNEIAEKVHTHVNYINSRKESGIKSAEVRKQKGIVWNLYLSDEQINEYKKRSSERMKKNNPMFKPENVIKSIQNRPSQHQKKSKYEKMVIELLHELGIHDSVWFSGHGDYFVTNTNTGKVRNPDFKIHKQNKVIEVGIEYYRRPDFNAYVKECTHHYNEMGYDVLVINGEDDTNIIKHNLLTFYRNGLKIIKKKHFKDIVYYKDSKPKIRTYNSYNIQCHPYSNYIVRTTKSTEALINHNCSWKDKDGRIVTCDTPYTSFHQDNIETLDFAILQDKLNKYPRVNHIVLTGGEPTIQKDIVDFVKYFKYYNITIETNGTVFNKELAAQPNVFFSFSPKLSNSNFAEDELARSLHIKNNKWQNTVHQYARQWKNNFQLKFVVTSPSDFNEIDAFVQTSEVYNDTVYIMPMGIDEQELNNNIQSILDAIYVRGYNLTDRLHIRIWGNKRGV